MEIIWRNFKYYDKEIVFEIENSDFVSIDLRTTGILPSENDEKENDKINDINDNELKTEMNQYIYNKYKKIVQQHTIIQLGITIFKNISSSDDPQKKIVYECHPYCLYLFINSKDLKFQGEIEFSLDLLHLRYLKEQNIDFNKWINDGIYYMNDDQYITLYDGLIKNNINNDDFSIDPSLLKLKPKDLDRVNENIEEVIDQFINKENPEINSYLIDNLPKFLLYYVKTKLPNNFYYQENFRLKSKWCTLITRFHNKEEKEKLHISDIKSQIEDLNYKQGAKKVFDALTNKYFCAEGEDEKNIKKGQIKYHFKTNQTNKKTIIGHNIFLNLMFLMSKLDNDLPDKYDAYQKLINEKFETIYDTKYLFEKYKNFLYENMNVQMNNEKNNNINNKSDIDTMYQFLNSKLSDCVNIEMRPHKDLFRDESYGVAYDSYITGISFLYLKHGIKNVDLLKGNENCFSSLGGWAQ